MIAKKLKVHTGKTVSVSTPQLTNDYLFVSHGWTLRPKTFAWKAKTDLWFKNDFEGLGRAHTLPLGRTLVGGSHFPTAQLSKLSLRNRLGYIL